MDLGASSGADRWKDVLLLLRQQSNQMKKLARALSYIRQGMLRNNPGHVIDSVKEATEMLSGMLNTHMCLLENQKRLESHPASKRWVSFGDRALRLWEILQKSWQRRWGELFLLPSRIGFPRKVRASHRQHTLRPPEARRHKRMGNSSWEKKGKEKKRRREESFLCPLRRILMLMGRYRSALWPPGRATQSECRRSTVIPMLRSWKPWGKQWTFYKICNIFIILH